MTATYNTCAPQHCRVCELIDYIELKAVPLIQHLSSAMQSSERANDTDLCSGDKRSRKTEVRRTSTPEDSTGKVRIHKHQNPDSW